jgi:hypothetical protein
MHGPAIGEQTLSQGKSETLGSTGDEGGGHWNRGMEDWRAGGLESRTKGCAKVQIGAELLCKSAKVIPGLAGPLTSGPVDKGD